MKNEIVFSDKFKSMWEKDSPVSQEWTVLELHYTSICVIAENLAIKSSTFRNILDIEADIKANPSKVQTEALRLEIIYILWNRLLLRTCYKVRDALQLLIYSSNTINSYGCALATRSIIEHVALLNYFVQKIPWLESPIVKKENLAVFIQQISLLTVGSTFDWDKFLAGNISLRTILASKEWKRPRNQRIPEISTLIKSLDEKLSNLQSKDTSGRIEFLYSILCDVVHPSWGGDFIYAPKMNQDMQIDKDFDKHFKKIATILCLPTSEITRHLIDLIKIMTDNEPQKLGFYK